MIKVQNRFQTKILAIGIALLGVVALASCTNFKRWAYTRGDRDA